MLLYIYIYISYKNGNNTIFFKQFKRQVSENINFLIKIIYNILCTIKKYIKFENYFEVLNKSSPSLFFLLYNPKHQITNLKN